MSELLEVIRYEIYYASLPGSHKRYHPHPGCLLSQVNAAKILKSSQSRISKIETADPTVSIDLQIKSLLALGATKEDIGQKIAC
jgi:hypothetical protein